MINGIQSFLRVAKADTLKSSGYIMNKDIKVAIVKDDHIEIVIDWLCPLIILRTEDFESWLSSRSIDTHRPNSRKLRKMLRITDDSERSLVLKNYGVTVTDSYWFKPKDSQLNWSDVDIKDDRLWDSALNGFFEELQDSNVPTMELTNIGSYEKCWRRKNNVWYLYKKSTRDGLYSELLAYRLGKYLGFPMAIYKTDGDLIISKDFTNNREFNYEAMSSIVAGEEDFTFNINMLRDLERMYNCKLVEDYLDILLMDYLVYNVDRHTDNYGVLRSPSTGNVLRMAPNYDNNLCLFCASSKGLPSHSPLMLLMFYLKACRYAGVEPKKFNYIEEELKIVSDIDGMDNIYKESFVTFIMNNMDNLNKYSLE